MYVESNYPVDGQTISYCVLWNAFKKVSDRHGEGERADLFAQTARRVYRIQLGASVVDLSYRSNQT